MRCETCGITSGALARSHAAARAYFRSPHTHTHRNTLRHTQMKLQAALPLELSCTASSGCRASVEHVTWQTCLQIDFQCFHLCMPRTPHAPQISRTCLTELSLIFRLDVFHLSSQRWRSSCPRVSPTIAMPGTKAATTGATCARATATPTSTAGNMSKSNNCEGGDKGEALHPP